MDFGQYSGYYSEIQGVKTNCNLSKSPNGNNTCLKVDIHWLCTLFWDLSMGKFFKMGYFLEYFMVNHSNAHRYGNKRMDAMGTQPKPSFGLQLK